MGGDINFEEINKNMHKDIYWQAGEIDRLEKENASLRTTLATERDQFGKRETEHIKKVRIEIGRRTLAEGKIIKLEVALENIINKIVPIYAKEHGILVSEIVVLAKQALSAEEGV